MNNNINITLDEAHLAKLVASIDKTHDIHSMHQLLGEITTALGFDHFSYITQVPLSPTRVYYFLISEMPQEWTDHYKDRHYAAVDPVMQYVSETKTAVFWDDIALKVDLCQEMIEDAERCGVRFGATAPISDSGLRGGLFSIARGQPVSQDVVERQRILLWLQWVGVQLHQQVQNTLLVHAEGLHEPELTKRERQCLAWAAEGKTSWEIGQIVGISEKTVVHHLRGASYKLGCNRRQGAITKAVACGALQTSWQDGLSSESVWEGKY